MSYGYIALSYKPELLRTKKCKRLDRRSKIANRASYRTLFANRDFGLLIFAQGVSNFGDWLIVGILVSLVATLVPPKINPALALAGLWIAKIAPSLFLSPFIGAFVDRLDRKKGMIFSDIIRGIIIALLPLATTYGGLTLVYAVIFLQETFTLFFVPAKDASIPNLVQKNQLVDANSLSFTINQVTMLIGLTVGTTAILIVKRLLTSIPLLKGLAGTYTAVYIDAGTFFVSAAVVSLIRLPLKRTPIDRTAYHTIFEEVKDTFRFIGSNPKIKSIIISAGISVLGLGTILIIGPQYAQADLGLGRDGFLILLTLLAFGLVGGALSSSWLTHLISKESLFSLSLLVLGLSLVAFATYVVIPMAFFLSFASGFSLGILYVATYTIFHEQVSDIIRGRLFTALEADLRLALIISFLVTSTVASIIGDQRLTIFGRQVTVHSSQMVMFFGGLIVIVVSVYAFNVTRAITRKAIIAKFTNRFRKK